jgi:archaellum component FlaC
MSRSKGTPFSRVRYTKDKKKRALKREQLKEKLSGIDEAQTLKAHIVQLNQRLTELENNTERWLDCIGGLRKQLQDTSEFAEYLKVQIKKLKHINSRIKQSRKRVLDHSFKTKKAQLMYEAVEEYVHGKITEPHPKWDPDESEEET